MVEEFYFTSSTKKQIYAKKWYNEKIEHPKAIVQLVHGMEEHIGRYDEFANFLTQNGFIVVGHDHLGHGKTAKTEDELGYFTEKNGWFALTEDIHILQNKIQKENPNLPYFIMGHSMGSLLVRTYVTLYDDSLNGIIITGTSGQRAGLLTGKILTKCLMVWKGKKYKSKFIASMVTGSFNRQFKPNKTPADWTTRDEKIIEEHIKDTNPHCRFTVSSYYELFYGSSYLNKKKNIEKTPNIPILIFSGDKDPVGQKGKGVKRVYHRLKKTGKDDVTFKLFPEGRHEMLNEINREEVFNFVLSWIENKIQS